MANINIDLTTLSGWSSLTTGTHAITVKAKASGYLDSNASNSVNVTKAASGYSLTADLDNSFDGSLNITYSGGTTATITESGTYSNVISINSYSYGGKYFDCFTVNDESATTPYTLTQDSTVVLASSCFVAETQITLANGTTKNVENITYDDDLLVWNFFDKKYDHAKPSWIMRERTTDVYKLVTFSDGNTLKLVGEGNKAHRLYNVTKQKFLHANECLGDEIYTENGIVTMTGYDIIQEQVKYYNLRTEKYLDCFANGVLTGGRLNNMYEINDMKYINDVRLISVEEELESNNRHELLRLPR